MTKRFPTLMFLAAILTTSLALLLPSHNPARAVDHIVLESHDLIIVSEKSLVDTAARLGEAFPKLRADLEDMLGWKLESEPVVRLIGERDIFEQMSGSPHYSALAVPARSLIVMFVPPAKTNWLTLNETFKHELCHLLLHDHIQEALLPKWLDEGVCQWVSGSLGEILSGGGFPQTEIALASRPIPLRRLTYSFPRDKDSLALAYEESRRFVEFLTASYGRESLLGILEHLSEGDDIDRAVSETLSKSFDAVEQEWLDSLKGRFVWLIWASRHMYDILFVVAALLTVLAFVSLALRKKRYREEEEEEEDEE